MASSGRWGSTTVRKIYLIAGLSLGISVCLLGVVQFQGYVSQGMQGYVHGEGLWAKAQKDAILHLVRYADSGDQSHYRAFRQALQIPLGYRRARLELEAPDPDLPVVREGLMTGGSAPRDIGPMVFLFRVFHDLPYMADAIAIWRRADTLILRLEQVGEQIHGRVSLGAPAAPEVQRLLAELDGINRTLTRLEEEFSVLQTNGARWIHGAVRWAAVALMAALIGIAGLVLWRITAKIAKTEAALVRSEERFRSLADANVLGIVFWAQDGTIREANDAFLGLVGYPRTALGRLNWTDLTPNPARPVHERAVRDLGAQGRCTPYEQELQRRDGTRVSVYLGGTTVARQSESPYVSFVLDVSERKRAEEKLRLAATVFESSGEGIMVTDAQARILSVNRAFCDMTGYQPGEVVDKTPALLRSGLMSPQFYEEMWETLRKEGRWQGEVLDRRRSGELLPARLSISCVRDDVGELSHYVAIFSDITERKAMEDELRHQAQHDALTGLPNRLLFEDRLQQALVRAERRGAKVALLFLDLDRFKPVNDAWGHHIGDKLLQHVAKRLVGAVRGGDTVCRLGGDEFVVLLEEIDGEPAASEVAEKILDTVNEPFMIDNETLYVSPSIGICLYPRDGADAQTLVQNADRAMYHAKSVGGSRFQFFG